MAFNRAWPRAAAAFWDNKDGDTQNTFFPISGGNGGGIRVVDGVAGFVCQAELLRLTFEFLEVGGGVMPSSSREIQDEGEEKLCFWWQI